MRKVLEVCYWWVLAPMFLVVCYPLFLVIVLVLQGKPPDPAYSRPFERTTIIAL